MTKKRPKVSPVIRQAKGPRPRVFPAHLASTPDEWRALKRQEWREVMQALQRYSYGSAYAPGSRQLWSLAQLAEEVRDLVEPDDWIAW